MTEFFDTHKYESTKEILNYSDPTYYTMSKTAIKADYISKNIVELAPKILRCYLIQSWTYPYSYEKSTAVYQREPWNEIDVNANVDVEPVLMGEKSSVFIDARGVLCTPSTGPKPNLIFDTADVNSVTLIQGCV